MNLKDKMIVGNFPFGGPIRRVSETDHGPKHVFVLGAYASAVHARWRNPQGKQVVKALAVASEPYIFWRGEKAEEILSDIILPSGVGYLGPAQHNLNGPSGRSIDEDYMKAIGMLRVDAWLCDLVPHSCMNPSQAKAIAREYEPLVERFALPPAKWPAVPRKLANTARRQEISEELRCSAAEVVITLGDLPLKWFTSEYGSKQSLRAYGETQSTYGRLHDLPFNGRRLKHLPLVHPRQAAGLSGHTAKWKELHRAWKRDIAPGLFSAA